MHSPDLQPQEYEQILQHLSASLDIQAQLDWQWERLYNIIYAKVAELMTKNPQELVQLLYRLDISEQKVAVALNESPLRQAADNIASLILERQLEKIKTRRLYKNHAKNQKDDDAERW